MKLVEEYDDTFQGKKIGMDHLFYDHPDDRLLITEETKDYYRQEVDSPTSGLYKLIFGNQMPGSDYHIYAKKHNHKCL